MLLRLYHALSQTQTTTNKLTDKLATTDLLVLDDFLTTPISGDTANALFNIIADREHKGSTLITS
ncbi:ATP-binding protein [Corynebacterium cystitidis]|uniref:ATP-binding protein n=1 Tax=Corynebacterium cystitidis TaxID=35757 RepID=UPI00211E9B61|nr:ATP-binding protein [Corynebacterium cystitidis]